MYCWKNDWILCVTVNLYGSKWSNFVAVFTEYFETLISGDKHLKDFCGHDLKHTPVTSIFLLKEHIVNTLPSSLIRNLLFRLCSSVDMLLTGTWNTGKPTSKFPLAIFIGLISHNPPPPPEKKETVYNTALHVHKQKQLLYVTMKSQCWPVLIFTNHKQNLHLSVWT
jgi:hypothetical protein